jgi:twitching motility protein PilT
MQKKADAPGRLRIEEILTNLVVQNGSDLHLKVGRRPLFRITGELVESNFPTVDDTEIRGILLEVLGQEGFQTLERNCEYDAAFVISDIARFRVNAYRQMDHYGMAFRPIPMDPPTIDAMELPPVLKDICKVPQGLVLVTGPTGSGKSTTLAAMIDHLNESQPLHIMTIEDPIEFVYKDKKCTINQRQLGRDILTVQEAMRRVLRQDPDVILLGEMRDRETIELAIHAAETGHLVFSTLHTNDAKQTFDRIVDTFPPDSAHTIRSMLSMTLHAIVCQRLVRRADGKGRIAAVEVLVNSPQIRGLLAEGKTSQIEKAIASSGDFYKMQTFNQTLAKMALSGVITQEEALANSTNPGDLTLLLKGVGRSAETAPVPEPTKPRPPRF